MADLIFYKYEISGSGAYGSVNWLFNCENKLILLRSVFDSRL